MSDRPTVLLADPFISAVVRKELAPHARILIARNRAQFIKLAPQADGMVVRFSDRVDEALLRHAPRLRAVACFSVGTDQIDFEACRARGIRVCNTPDVLTRATAELALTLLLSTARRVPEGDTLCRGGRFAGWESNMLLGLELQGRTAVLVGPGRIGLETAKLFEGVGLNVQWLKRGSTPREIQAKLRRAQVLSLHLPLTPQSRPWLTAARLRLLPKDAIVINTTRGPVIDESALIQALRARRIFGAGLDVYEHEPRIPAALRRLPNVVLLPHLGSATTRAREGMARLAFQGLRALLNGQNPTNEVKF